MKITAITIENFKGISEPVRVELKPITLLFGANSVGKSTIVQALHYVREILERNNVDADRCLGADESLDLGGFRNLVHNHDLARCIRIKIEMELEPGEISGIEYSHQNKSALSNAENWEVIKKDLGLANKATPNSDGWKTIEGTAWDINEVVDIKTVWLELQIGWDDIKQAPRLYTYTTGFNDSPFAQLLQEEDNGRISFLGIDFEHPSLQIHDCSCCKVIPYNQVLNGDVVNTEDGINLWLEDTWSTLSQISGPLSIAQTCYVEPFEEGPYYAMVEQCEAYLTQLIIGPRELLLSSLKECRYIGPIRKVPSRDYTPPRYSDESRWASGLATWDLLFKADTKLLSDTSDWLSKKDRLNSGYSIRMYNYKKLDMAGDLYKTLLTKGTKGKAAVADLIERLPEDRQLLLTDERRKLDVLPQDVGIGISQILPVVVGALDKETSILMVEQPELHIHPGLQTTLGDLFISQIQEEGKTFIIETHSEHLLLRLLRRIRETNDGELPEGIDGLTPEQVSVNYVELDEDGLRIRPLRISKEGESLGAWPKGFFAERLKELF